MSKSTRWNLLALALAIGVTACDGRSPQVALASSTNPVATGSSQR